MQSNECNGKTKIRRENLCDRQGIFVRCGSERQKAYVCTRARRKWQNPCVEREREREVTVEYIYMYMAEGETSRG